MFDFLNRGLLMDEAGGGDDGGGGAAVADAGSDYGGADAGADTSEGGTDGTVHDAEFVEAAPAAEPRTALVKAGERAVMNGKVTPSGRAAIEAVKALSPKLAQEFIQAGLTRDWFMKEFPGGKKEVAQLRQLAQQHGGEQGIADLRSIADQMQEIDTMYEASDPRFIEKITDTEDQKRSFVGLMGPALQKFAALAPERMKHEMAKGFMTFLDNARLPVSVARMADLLNRAITYSKAGNNEAAASLIGELATSHNEITDILEREIYLPAKTAPAAPAKAAPNDREQQLTQKEKDLQKREWEGDVSNERRRIFSRAWSEVTKGRTLTKDQDLNVKGFYDMRMQVKIRQWQNQAQRFMANGDKYGYMKEQSAFFQKAIPDALRQAITQALPAKPGPRPAGGPVKPPLNGAAPAQGVLRVSKMPPTSQLDVMRTTSDMLSANKAVTKDGRTVQWA